MKPNYAEDLIKNEEFLKEILEKMDFSDDSLIPPMSILLWNGVKFEELPGLRDNQVNFANRRVFDQTGEPISSPMSDFSIEVLKNYQESGLNYKPGSFMRKDVKSDRFLRRMVSYEYKSEGKPLTEAGLHTALSRAQIKCTEIFGHGYLSPGVLFRSGRFCKLLELEESGFVIDDSLMGLVFRGELSIENIKKIYKAFKQL